MIRGSQAIQVKWKSSDSGCKVLLVYTTCPQNIYPALIQTSVTVFLFRCATHWTPLRLQCSLSVIVVCALVHHRHHYLVTSLLCVWVLRFWGQVAFMSPPRSMVMTSDCSNFYIDMALANHSIVWDHANQWECLAALCSVVLPSFVRQD